MFNLRDQKMLERPVPEPDAVRDDIQDLEDEESLFAARKVARYPAGFSRGVLELALRWMLWEWERVAELEKGYSG
jgi:hypothetical protein